jgi:hypothetical protein
VAWPPALAMRPLTAHCHLDVGALYLRAVKLDRAFEDLGIAMTLYASWAWRPGSREPAANGRSCRERSPVPDATRSQSMTALVYARRPVTW